MKLKKPQLFTRKKEDEKRKRNYTSFIFVEEKNIFYGFPDFSETVHYKDMKFFVLLSVHHDASFELSKSTIGQFFKCFTQREDPFDLDRVKIICFDMLYPTDETRINLKSLGQIHFQNSLIGILSFSWYIWPLPSAHWTRTPPYEDHKPV